VRFAVFDLLRLVNDQVGQLAARAVMSQLVLKKDLKRKKTES